MPKAQLSQIEGHDSLVSRELALTFRERPRYLLEEILRDIRSGHNIKATVYVEAHSMYRNDGPAAMKSVGEVEFANGVAAMAASGVFGDARICAAIVGGADLASDDIEDILTAHVLAGGHRYRGVRNVALFDEDASILGVGAGVPHLLADSRFRRGFKLLDRFGLLFEALVLEPQLVDLIELARAFPDTQIVLDHVGVPVGIGRFAGQREQRFATWRENIHTLSACQNVAVKLGGLGVPFGGFHCYRQVPLASSAQIADEWKPYIETCIEAFGVDRCMFESNFAIDSAVSSYAVLWNVFKRLTLDASEDEKAALFYDTAARIYRLNA
jgi:L-fuconolactonase